jgi:hypothetical protein
LRLELGSIMSLFHSYGLEVINEFGITILGVSTRVPVFDG